VLTVPLIWHESYEVDIGPHVFPMGKYRAVRDRLVAQGRVREAEIEAPEPAALSDLARVHTREYLQKVETGGFPPDELVRLELPFSPALRDASRLAVGGTILAGRRAVQQGVAVHLGGGFHHAFPDHGEGFCLLNDVAVAIRVLLAEGTAQRAAVVDCDVHHGNGTAHVFGGDAGVFTFSMHQQRNYPLVKPPSRVDVGLEDGTGDGEYLWHLEEHLPAVLAHRPGIAFYLAGADPYEWDQLGGLGLTIDGLKRRDQLVFESFRAAGVPVAVVLAGGYALNPDDTVEIHCNTVRAAQTVFSGKLQR
jgi:acetoin utilization deacetylase AcuC-like enzyme